MEGFFLGLHYSRAAPGSGVGGPSATAKQKERAPSGDETLPFRSQGALDSLAKLDRLVKEPLQLHGLLAEVPLVIRWKTRYSTLECRFAFRQQLKQAPGLVRHQQMALVQHGYHVGPPRQAELP